MPDSKITALTALTAADPANDMIPIVDVSDTPPASGNTKRISINNILACSPTATLASATISGDLTVRTNQLIANANGVGVGTAPSAWSGIGPALQVEQASLLSESSNQLYLTANGYFAGGQWNYINNASADQYYQIAGSHVWRSAISGTAGTAIGWSTLMTLNSTGLGVGVSPSYKLDIGGTGSQQFRIQMSGQADTRVISDTGAGIIGTYSNHPLVIRSNSITAITVDTSQNVGIGVLPGYKLDVNGTGKASSGWGVGDSSGNLSGTFINESDVSKSLTINADPGNVGANSLMQFKIDGSTRLTIDSSGNVISNVTGTAPTLATNSQMVFNLTSNTNLRISVRGTDGVTRTANITLA